MSGEGFAAVPTWMIRDERISRNAILVYLSLASRGGYAAVVPSKKTIATEARCSVRTVAYALDELERLGVLERMPRQGATGAQLSNEYVLSNRPRGVHTLHGEGAHTAQGGCKNEHSIPYIQIDRLEIDKPPTPYDLESLFAEAWERWPKKKERKESLAKFKLKVRDHFKDDPRVLVDLIKQFGEAYAATTETQYVPALCFWLNRERWTDELPVASRSRNGRPSPLEVGRAVDEMLRAEAAQIVAGEIGVA